jgi:hypothetical protein
VRLTLEQLTDQTLSDIRASVAWVINMKARGQNVDLPFQSLVSELEQSIAQRVVDAKMTMDPPPKPWANVSSDDWSEAYTEACQRIYDTEPEEREPLQKEIEAQLDLIQERRRDNA